MLTPTISEPQAQVMADSPFIGLPDITTTVSPRSLPMPVFSTLSHNILKLKRCGLRIGILEEHSGTNANSPHKAVDKWTAPIMISVGEKDYRILASQGMMAFNAAKLRGIPTRMLVYPNENHWILKPQNALLWQREFFSWFDKWLKTDK